jgi:hypothetical protein
MTMRRPSKVRPATESNKELQDHMARMRRKAQAEEAAQQRRLKIALREEGLRKQRWQKEVAALSPEALQAKVRRAQQDLEKVEPSFQVAIANLLTFYLKAKRERDAADHRAKWRRATGGV